MCHTEQSHLKMFLISFTSDRESLCICVNYMNIKADIKFLLDNAYGM